MDAPSDIDAVLDEIERGRTDAFGQVVRAYALPLRSYLASQVHHLEDVDDLAQEVFLTAFRNLSGYRRGEDFGAWLRGIARNKLLTYFRSQSRRNQAMQRFREEVARTLDHEHPRGGGEEAFGATGQLHPDAAVGGPVQVEGGLRRLSPGRLFLGQIQVGGPRAASGPG